MRALEAVVSPRTQIGVKRRHAGTPEAACASAWAQGGGVKRVEAASGIKAKRLYEAADPDAGDRQKELTWREVCRLERDPDLAITAFSDALVAQRGGVVLDGGDTRDVSVLKPALLRVAHAATEALFDDRNEAAVIALEQLLRHAAALHAALNARARR